MRPTLTLSGAGAVDLDALTKRHFTGPRPPQREVRRSFGLEVFRGEVSVLADASQHPGSDLIAIMKGEDEIRPAGATENLVRSSLALD